LNQEYKNHCWFINQHQNVGRLE